MKLNLESSILHIFNNVNIFRFPFKGMVNFILKLNVFERNIIICSILTVFLLGSLKVSAEGSRNLFPAGATGYRAFLTSANTASVNYCGIINTGKMYAYAKAGEVIYIGSSAMNRSGSIRVTNPIGNVQTYSGSSTGQIGNRSQELVGPSALASGGYNAIARSVTATTEGIWTIEFLSSNMGADLNTSSNASHNLVANDNWGSSDQSTNTPMIIAWDITVANGSSVKNGRVYMNVFTASLGNTGQQFNGDIFVLTHDGFQYKYSGNGLAPWVYAFFANNKGLKVDNTNQPIYKSARNEDVINYPDYTNPSFEFHDPTTLDTDNDVTHLLFFNTPNNDMPANANYFLGGVKSRWLYKAIPPTITITNLDIVGMEGESFLGTGGLAGANIKFTANVSSNYEIKIDANNNGSYTDAVDVTLTGGAISGSNTVYWDGKNASGVMVPNNNIIKVKVSLLYGEVHFPISDAENNNNGIKLQRILPTPSDYTVYWDDSTVGGSSSLTGTNSSTGAHAWTSNFGDVKFIDTWTYQVGATAEIIKTIVRKQTDLETVSLIQSSAALCSGNNITYTTVVRNNGPDNATGAKFIFTVPAGVTINSVSRVISGIGNSTSTSTPGTTYIANVDLNNGSTITYTINATITGAIVGTITAQSAMLRATNVSDPDATNPDNGIPTNPNNECDSQPSGVGCNNIKTITATVGPTTLGGATSVCVGSTANVTPTTGGTWISSNNLIATVTNAGVVTGVAPGTVTLTFTNTAGCPNTRSLTVNALPTLGGATSVEIGSSIIVTPTSGGTWSSSNNAIVEVTNDGVAYGIALGTVVLTFTDGVTGCKNTRSVTVVPIIDQCNAALSGNLDSDGDGISDICDLDDDNDGILDVVEGGKVCASTVTSSLNTLPYPFNTLLNTSTTNTPVNVPNLISGSLNFNVTLNGSAKWNTADGTPPNNGGGVQIKNNGGITVGDYIYLQPLEAPSNSLTGANTSNFAEATLNFSPSVNGLSFYSSGLNNYDCFEIYAYNGTTPIPLNISNLSNFSPMNNSTNWDVMDLGDAVKVVGKTGDGGTDVNTNYFKISIPGDVTRVKIKIYKNGGSNQNNTVSVGITSFEYCTTAPFRDTDNDGIPDFLDLDSDNDGCYDAIEGDENVQNNQLNANGSISGTVNANGVPNLVNTGGVADIGSDQGQGVGNSANASISTCPLAENDINQTPLNTAVSGQLMTNDEGVTSIASANIGGTNIPLATATTVSGVDDSGLAVSNAGSIIINSNGTYTFTPATGFTGTINPITYIGTGAGGSSDNAVLSIEVLPKVNPGNNPPVAQNDVASTEVNIAVSSSVMPNDSDPDGNTLTVASALYPGGGITIGTATVVSGISASGAAVTNAGSLLLNSNGTYTFTPTTGFVGTINDITYTISDGNGGTDTAILSINVLQNVGNTTFANDDANAKPQGTTMTGNILTNDTDPEGNPQSVTAVTFNGTTVPVGTPTAIPSVGTLTLNSDGTYSFVPLASFTGTAAFIYTKCDNGTPQACDQATLYLTCLPRTIIAENDINQVPMNTAVSGQLMTNDEGVTSIASATIGGTNIPLATATTVSGIDDSGTAVANAGTITINSNGTYTFTPASGFIGTINPITYVGAGANGATDNAILSIEVLPKVNPGNNPPVAQNDVATTEANITVSSSVMPNDSDPDGNTLTVTSASIALGSTITVQGVNTLGVTVTAGTVNLSSTGTYTYIPATGFIGTVNDITYTISDGNGGTDTAILNINVLPNNGNTTFANDDANAKPQGTTMTGNILTNDTDPEGNTQTVTTVNVNGTNVPVGTTTTIPSIGTLTVSSTGVYTFVPISTFIGTIPVTYTKCDNGTPQACDEATLYLTSIPYTIIAENDINQTPLNTAVSGQLMTNDEGVTSISSATIGGSNITLATATVVAGVNDAGAAVSNAGSITINSNGTYTFTPAIGFTGTINPITYVGAGLGGATDNAILSIEVLPRKTSGNNPPVAQNDVNTTEVNVTITGSTVLNNDSDPDGNTLTITAASIGGSPFTFGTAKVVSGVNLGGTAVTNAGSLTINSNGTYTFVPASGFSGTVNDVNYTISDGNGGTDAAILSINVLPNNGNTTFANDDANVKPQGTTMTGNVLTNDFDPEGHTHTVSSATVNGTGITIGSAFTITGVGAFTLNTNGSYSFVPLASFVGTQRVIYNKCDNGSPVACDEATLYLTSLPTTKSCLVSNKNVTPKIK